MSLKEVLYGCSLSKVLYLAEITVYNIWDHLLYVLIDFYVHNVGVHEKLITLYTVQLGGKKMAQHIGATINRPPFALIYI